jgi:hypothetical protein
MKRSIAIALFLCALCSRSFGVILFFVDAPQDVREMRALAGERPELKPLHDEYFDIIKTRLWPLRFSEMEKIFGPKLNTATNWWGSTEGERSEASGPKVGHYPADLVLPVFASKGGTNCGGTLTMMVSGLHSTDPAQNRSHTDLYAVGDIGYAEIYSHLDGEKVQTGVIYFRADDKFVPLKSTNDFTARLAWDTAKFEALKSWFASHLDAVEDMKKLSPKGLNEPKK